MMVGAGLRVAVDGLRSARRMLAALDCVGDERWDIDTSDDRDALRKIACEALGIPFVVTMSTRTESLALTSKGVRDSYQHDLPRYMSTHTRPCDRPAYARIAAGAHR